MTGNLDIEARKSPNDPLELGRKAALLIWDDAEDAALIEDPRDPAFSAGVMTGLSLAMAKAPGLMRKLVEGIASVVI